MPFLYPKNKHRRKLVPPLFPHYKKFKPFLQKEFSNKCVYCMTPDTIKGYDFFGVDHYRPQKKFPHLINEYLNLFYSCNRCNRLKRDFWIINNKDEIFIPNPCEHIMFEHLRFIDETVLPKSEAGQFTVETLYLNDQEIVEFRKCLITSKKALYSQLNDLEKVVKSIDVLITDAKPRKREKLVKEKNEIMEDINKIKNSINIILGIREKTCTM